MRRNNFFLLFVLLAAACTPPEKLSLQPQAYDDLGGWHTDNHAPALAAFKKSCEVMMKKDDEATLGGQMGQVKDWRPACEAAAHVPTKGRHHARLAREFFETYFTPLKSISSRRPDGLFTGYYEIELNGSLKKTSRYKYPVYRKPPEELRTLTRAEINAGGLEGKGLELLYVDDPVRLFFMQVQGSGIVHLKNGKRIRLNYDGQNGQPYVSLGRWLIDNGYMAQEDVDAPAIKKWLYDNADIAHCVMEQNPSYIYFKRRDDLAHADGPIGGQTVPLTAYRSLAVDKKFYGYGTPMWIETDLPNGKNFNQLMIAQDTGGAIRGAIRGDLFCGRGKRAETLAGYMNNRGNLWILLPKTIAAQYHDEQE